MTSSPTFAQRHVAAFESRRAAEMKKLITRFQGNAHVSPAMREVPVKDHRPAVDLANRILVGQIDVVIFLTGVGTRYFFEQIDRRVDVQRLVATLGDIKTVARGPKPLSALREFEITPTLQVPQPNTWREILQELDKHLPVSNLVVAIQEYGEANTSLISGLEARGATVESVHIYDWQLPEDTDPLLANIQSILSGNIDVTLFTAAAQINNLFKMADDQNQQSALIHSLRKTVVGSIGPTTTEKLRSFGILPDIEPTHPKMGHLVQETAEQCETLAKRKSLTSNRVVVTNRAQQEIRMTSSEKPIEELPPYHDGPFLRACRGEEVPYTPVWLMRQAGRYMPEYRQVRSKSTFLELCKNPQRCSEVMCTAVEYLGVDAAIVFSDLLPILEPMGINLEFSAGEGPVIHNPIRVPGDVDRFHRLESMESLQFVTDAIRQTRSDLSDDIPLIGFAGAPFTLASYVIEGGSSRNFVHTKAFMYRDPTAWHELLSRLTSSLVLYLTAQVDAGAQALQVFDSWVGCLSPVDYREFVLPHQIELFAHLPRSIPVINFGTGNPQLLPLYAEPAPAVVGVDWRIPIADAVQQVGQRAAVQGNLDPLVLLGDHHFIRQRAAAVLQGAKHASGHIFNLGHGVVPQTPPENAKALVDIVHELSSH